MPHPCSPHTHTRTHTSEQHTRTDERNYWSVGEMSQNCVFIQISEERREDKKIKAHHTTATDRTARTNTHTFTHSYARKICKFHSIKDIFPFEDGVMTFQLHANRTVTQIDRRLP